LFTIIGMVFGFIGMGNSRQLRTPHGIIGFLTSLVAIILVVSHYIRNRRLSQVSTHTIDDEPVPKARSRPWVVHTTNIILPSLLLAFGYIGFVTGFSDLRTFSMCMVEAAINLPLAILLGSVAMALIVAAVTMMIVRYWIERMGERSEMTGMGEVEIGVMMEKSY